ncbi:DgyrCDS376 [Dimorphilus gyrociliatus]|uniref:Protein SERAC1 n=1 Tax=Dimorphilus gyrociliatus TaxID=2664684 RepID=A0A7I8V4A5_9ANNE|nr:DgyrCDS376 [Dimorphilus gyrociliatus]
MSISWVKIKKIPLLFYSIRKRVSVKSLGKNARFAGATAVGLGGLFIGYYTKNNANPLSLDENETAILQKNKLKFWNFFNNLSLSLQAKLSRNIQTLLNLAEHHESYIRDLAINNIIQTEWSDNDLNLIELVASDRIQVLISLKEKTNLELLKFKENLKPCGESLELLMKESLKKIIPSDTYCKYLQNCALSEKWLSEEQQSWWSFSESSCEKIVELEDSEQFYAMYLDTYCTICQSDDYMQFLDNNGLLILRQILDDSPNDLLLTTKVAKILAVLSSHKETHYLISKSGFISLFAKWMRSSDLSLSLYASKSLWNMHDPTSIYADGVYLYFPLFLKSSEPEVDIIFVHGLKGGPFRTWRQKDSSDNKSPSCKCWPKDWLAKDIKNCRIIGVEYATKLSDWTSPNQDPLPLRAKFMAAKLKEAGVGKRPIIWVGHSMGGLLIKHMLEDEHLIEKSHGFIFYSVPHLGCPLASLTNNRLASIFSPSLEVRELHEGNKNLIKLNENFLEIIQHRQLPVFSFAEGSASQFPFGIKRIIVPESYAYPGIGEFRVMAELNHLDICKPKDRESDLYLETKNFILRNVFQKISIKAEEEKDYFYLRKFVCID